MYFKYALIFKYSYTVLGVCLQHMEHSSYNKLWSQEVPDNLTFPSQDLSSFNKALSLLPLEPCTSSKDQASPAPEMTEERSITIPRPQAQKKISEPGAMVSPTVTLLQGLRQNEKEMGESRNRKVIHKKLSTSPQPPSTDPGPDLICLLDPLNGAQAPTEPTLPSWPTLTPFQGQHTLSPITHVPHYFLQKYYKPGPPENPLNTAFLSPQATAYIHTPPVLMFSQASPMAGTTVNGAWPVEQAPQASSSNTSLYSLIDSPSSSCLSQALPPVHLTDKPNDPFSDLLTMATSTVIPTQTKRKREDLLRKWETFD